VRFDPTMRSNTFFLVRYECGTSLVSPNAFWYVKDAPVTFALLRCRRRSMQALVAGGVKVPAILCCLQ
jgi:hypothetical protein